MASFGGYVVLIVGLSLLLAMIGMQTTTGQVLGKFGINVTATSETNSFDVDASNLNGLDSQWFFSIFLGLSAVFILALGVRLASGGSFGIAETLKVTVVGTLISLMVMDFYGIFSYDYGSSIGVVTKIVSILIYLPMAIGTIISALDWIGGGR